MAMSAGSFRRTFGLPQRGELRLLESRALSIPYPTTPTIDNVTKLIDESLVVFADGLLTKYDGRDIEYCVVILTDTFENIPQDAEAVVPLEQRRVLNFELRAYALSPIHHWVEASQFEGVPHTSMFRSLLSNRVMSNPHELHTWTK